MSFGRSFPESMDLNMNVIPFPELRTGSFVAVLHYKPGHSKLILYGCISLFHVFSLSVICNSFEIIGFLGARMASYCAVAQ